MRDLILSAGAPSSAINLRMAAGQRRRGKTPTAAGAVEVSAPRVDDRRVDVATGLKQTSRSKNLPLWSRKSPMVTDVLPLLYLHGMSSGDFAPALEGFFGSAAGLSASVVTRLTRQWQDEARAFADPDLSEVDYRWTRGAVGQGDQLLAAPDQH